MPARGVVVEFREGVGLALRAVVEVRAIAADFIERVLAFEVVDVQAVVRAPRTVRRAERDETAEEKSVEAVAIVGEAIPAVAALVIGGRGHVRRLRNRP